MPSNLTFTATQAFRDRLLTRNLQPYSVPGVYSGPPAQQIVQPIIQSDYSVINSPDELISQDPFADLLYPLNSYGPTGGYNKNINVGGLASIRPNQGPYDYLDAKLPELSEPIQLQIPTQNRYSSSDPLQLISINNIQSVPTFQQYADPLNFTPSTYTPYQLLLNNNPTGSDGTLSQDSFIAQLGAKELRRLFQDRIAQNIEEKTIGRLNLLNAVGNPVQAILIAQGKMPLVEKDWTITRPSNIALRATDFLARLAGAYYPGSVIPGDYFTTDQQNLSSFGQISKAFNGGKDPRGGNFGKLFGRFLSQPSPSQLFLDNTGAATKSQLYYNLSFNRYSPQYKKSFFNTVLQNAKQRINDALDVPNKGGYYVGNEDNTVSTINSPSGEIPLNSFGQEVQSPVYGQDRLSIEFEGVAVNNTFKFGLDGQTYDDGMGVAGGFVWTAQKFNKPGYNQDKDGNFLVVDSEFKQNNFNSTVERYLTVSPDGNPFPFRQGSILDQTQRILDSTPHSSSRLKHAGNAINQLSKVFHDGYKIITKGSRVESFTNTQKGVYSGTNIFCRVFAKDTPYYTFADLQKTDGNIRKFNGSVLDSTYDINIAPVYGKNFSPMGVKKYMFSIENLAWRSSNRPGLTVNDLPACEIGPNGGRIMWFPPYDIKFNESSSPSFKGQDFLGRPEPVYTYSNTKRSGSLSWKIVVDHPSILNVIVDKELKNIGDKSTTNKVLESFFAGCLKFDIYELAKRWPTISVNELFVLQQQVITTQQTATPEKLEQVKNEVPKSEDVPEVKKQEVTPPDFNKYVGYAYYFENDIPKDSTSNWDNLYQSYISQQSVYLQNSPTNEQKNATGNFFTSAVTFNYEKTNELVSDIQKFFTDFKPVEGQETQPSISISLAGSASAVASVDYNFKLSQRRIDSVKNYLQSIPALQDYFRTGSLKIDQAKAEGEETTVYPITRDGQKASVGIDCRVLSKNATLYEKKYSPKAMACRRVAITSINVQVPEPKKSEAPPAEENVKPTIEKEREGYKGLQPAATTKTITTQQEQREGLSKKVLRRLLSECDYFNVVLKSNPMVYDSLKERLRYFHPTFHSTTPEGLNSRLTFLQQCMRPGDTIPVINKKGVAEYNNSVNTAFGAPPVLVLRIGDFFNTKIIPQSLQITYEPLLFDLNPEGIGVQPMLANVSLNFEIVGGEGLNGPIDKLQNALSFNFYANTEMYDERADYTDKSFQQYDDMLWDEILRDSPPVGINNTDNIIENPGGNTIGEIQTRFFLSNSVTGETIFRKIMDELHDSGQSYLNSVFNKTYEAITNYNIPIFNMFTTNREYNEGFGLEFTSQIPTFIVGKTNSYLNLVDELFNRIIEDIENQDSTSPEGNGLIFTFYYKEFPEKRCIDIVKKNLIEEVKKNKDRINNYLSTINQELVSKQTELVKIMAKLDIVDTLTDGYIKSNQSVQILDLVATPNVQQGSPWTNTKDELQGDYTEALNDINNFYQLFTSNQIVSQSSSYDFDNIVLSEPENFDILNCSTCTNAEKRFYMGMSNIFKDINTTEEFFQSLIRGINPSVNVSGTFPIDLIKTYYDDRVPLYNDEYNLEVDLFENNIKIPYDSTYKTWTPFVKGKERKFEYSTVDGTQTQITRISNLYKDGNSNTDPTTYNGKNKFN